MGSRVSVVIPMFNAAATVAETLGSLSAQTLRDWRAVVVDDGSTDGGAGIVAEVTRRDPRIRLVRQRNMGLPRARNTGLDELDRLDATEHAADRGAWRTGYLNFLDSDDWLLPHGLERLAAAAKRSGSGGACGAYELRNDAGRVIGRSVGPPATGVGLDELVENNRMVPCSHIIRRDVLGAERFDPRMTVVEDYDLWLRLADRGMRWAGVDREVVAYRLRPGSMSKNAPAMCAAVGECLRRARERINRRVKRLGSPFARGGDNGGLGLPDISDHRTRRVMRRHALVYGTIAALIDPADDKDCGAAIVAEWFGREPVDPQMAGEVAYWAVLFGRCEDPRTGLDDVDGAREDGWPSQAAAWWRRLARDGRCGDGFMEAAADSLLRELAGREATADELLAGAEPGGAVLIVGFGHNGRLIARRARDRGLRVLVCDDRLDDPGLRAAIDTDDAEVVSTASLGAAGLRADRVVVSPERDGALLDRVRSAGLDTMRWNEARDRVAAGLRGRLWGALRLPGAHPKRLKVA